MTAACLGEGWPRHEGDGVCWNIYDDTLYGASTFKKSPALDSALSAFGTQPDYPQEAAWRGQHHSGKMMSMNALTLYHNSHDETSRYPISYSLLWVLSEGAECKVAGSKPTYFEGGETATVCIITN